MKGVPWHKHKGDEYEDGEMPEGVEAEDPKKEAGEDEATKHQDHGKGCPEPVVVKMREPKPREFQIRKTDADKYGRTR